MHGQFWPISIKFWSAFLAAKLDILVLKKILGTSVDPKQHGLNETNEFQGAKVKMDESGNILLKRLGKSPVYVKVS